MKPTTSRGGWAVKKDHFVVALKVAEGGQVRPGKRLGDSAYRKQAFAEHALERLAAREGVHPSNVGIFRNGTMLVS